MKRETIFSLLMPVILVLTSCNKGCNSNSTNISSAVVSHPTVYVIDKVGRIVITASCPAGEQMIGGGYTLPQFKLNTIHFKSAADRTPEQTFDGTNTFTDKATACDSAQAPLIVEASYPSSKNTWTVIIFNQDPSPNCYHFGDFIEVDCYSVKSSNYNLNMKIDSVGPHPTNLPGAPPRLGDTCLAKVPGAVITAGGFKLDIDESTLKPWQANYMPLWGSYPKVDAHNKAIGWVSDYYTTVPQLAANITTYVLYSCPTTQFVYNLGNTTPNPGPSIPSPLVDGPVKNSPVEQTSGIDNRIGEVNCDMGYFSSGGGFKVVYAGQAPITSAVHSLPIEAYANTYVNGVKTMFAGWHSMALEDYNSP